jgi:hypothetical protein
LRGGPTRQFNSAFTIAADASFHPISCGNGDSRKLAPACFIVGASDSLENAIQLDGTMSSIIFYCDLRLITPSIHRREGGLYQLNYYV